MLRTTGLAGALLLLASACSPPAPAPSPSASAEPPRALDGARVIIRGARLTLQGVDAPRVENVRCPAEQLAGDLAAERLGGLLLAARQLDVTKTDAACADTAECEAVVKADGVDVVATLIEEGLVSRKAEPRDWCAAPAEPTATPPTPPT